ncbi:MULTISPECIES: type III pantothenate kinase [Thermodesulfovibrio]|jgi:type III pantothenate kinase|uniref:type III pantothenate kinase n=1 Tax=Thermodesulfovibrio TaxID=28261 RepID=UPI00262D925E|nr:type III pantothenate kinase [Thermodesulfovibrio sp.]
MLYAVKIGNSNIAISLFQNPLERNSILLINEPIATFDWHNLKSKIELKKPCVICSVVPSVTEKFLDKVSNYFTEILIVSHKVTTGLILLVDNPEKLGADRIACCVAAYELFKDSTAVVDLGTATTITIVSDRGEILGGTIMPGLQTMTRALRENTALLPMVTLDDKFEVPGRNTESAIKGGIILGTARAVEGLIEEIENSLNKNLKVVVTGGNFNLITHYLTIPHILQPSLVFEGMRLIYLKNINKFRRVL